MYGCLIIFSTIKGTRLWYEEMHKKLLKKKWINIYCCTNKAIIQFFNDEGANKVNKILLYYSLAHKLKQVIQNYRYFCCHRKLFSLYTTSDFSKKFRMWL